MNEGVVEGREDVRNTEDELALRNLGAERDGFGGGGDLGLLGGLWVSSDRQSSHPPQNASRFASSRMPTAPWDHNKATHHL